MDKDTIQNPTERERHEMTLEGLADVTTKRVVDHRIVQEWANNLTADAAKRAAKPT